MRICVGERRCAGARYLGGGGWGGRGREGTDCRSHAEPTGFLCVAVTMGTTNIENHTTRDCNDDCYHEEKELQRFQTTVDDMTQSEIRLYGEQHTAPAHLQQPVGLNVGPTPIHHRFRKSKVDVRNQQPHPQMR